MRRSFIGVLTLFAVIVAAGTAIQGARKAEAQTQAPAKTAPVRIPSQTERHSPTDLEVGGELAGYPPGTTRYISRDALLALPQVTFTAEDDAKFKAPTQVGGVPIENLVGDLAAAPNSDMVVAIASDGYRSNFTHSYLAAHHPLLVLEINGKASPVDWPKDADEGVDLGPYTVSYFKFTPSFKIFAHADEPQIPWGVVRLEFHSEKEVFGAIEPRGSHASEPAVQAGYRIAQQNCFRCHNMGKQGGQKSERPWLVLSAWATASPEFFAAYVRDPKTKNPHSAMPGNPNYDDSTITALEAYFRTFGPWEKP